MTAPTDKQIAQITAHFRVPLALVLGRSLTHENKDWQLRLYFRYYLMRLKVRVFIRRWFR